MYEKESSVDENMYFCKKDVTGVLSVFSWDVSCGKVWDIILAQVPHSIGCVYTRSIGKIFIEHRRIFSLWET
jgi:hypothetical protein